MEKETYLEKIEKHYQQGNTPFSKIEASKEAYISSTDKEKELIERQFDEYRKELDLKNYYNDVKAIKNNVQFFFWVSIISIISTIIFLIL
jgi:hypothetical protein